MTNIDILSEKHNVPKEDIFEMALGETNNILPGGLWHGYAVLVADEEMICYTKTHQTEFHIPYADFQQAVFGIGSGNLWLQCQIGGNSLVFCAPRKQWKSPAGKKLIEKISAVTPVQGMKEYEQFTGKLFWLYMFK